MKKIIGLCLALFMATTGVRADEGMWLLKLMKQQHLEDSLSKAGLQLPPEALYSETSPSLRDCIGIFGNGCTGEIISPEGLVLTNNHCGFGYIHAISTLEHNYLQDGYFAKNRSEELAVPGLDFTFVLRIVDVTAEVNKAAAKEGVDEYTAQSQSFLEPLAEKLLKKSDLKKKKGITVRIVPYFGGNQFYLFYEQAYPDVRLVANPPQNIAQFGFNQDNWMWPRHNADFMMFRIYADANGEPAAYSKDNQPLACRKHLPISLRGVEAGDYTMIMGFPGRTSRYLTAAEVELRTQSMNYPINLAGEAQLTYMKQLMDNDSVLNLKLADEYMSLGNMVKNFGGMNESVKKTGLINIKKAEEKAFLDFAHKSGKPEYQHIISRIDSMVTAVKDSLYDYYLFTYTIGQQKFQVPTTLVNDLINALEKNKEKDINAAKEALNKAFATVEATDLDLDHQMMELLFPYWQQHNRLGLQPDFLKDKATALAYYEKLYTASIFRSRTTLDAFLKQPSAEVLKNDPLYLHWKNFNDFQQKQFGDVLNHYTKKSAELDKIYTRGLCEMYNWAKAPDANFTLRMTYGHIKGYEPRDAVSYHWCTVLDGMLEKENPKDPDYVMNEKLRQLYAAKDFGRYARKDGKLPTCFLSNNDITGGNSGSPVMNAKGELIGLAFDGNIESLSSDLRFNPALQRCINVDIRYVLFLVDHFGGSKYLFDEMEIRQ
ncbi:hypothetical protein, secreted [gut metagenome]|uniref:Dipeptidyl-peptidase n=1 Tax=gut metagenome TaxID=749906 RepID=J9D2N0_9ZZZZ